MISLNHRHPRLKPSATTTGREEFTLPARPTTWGSIQDISADGRTARVVRTGKLTDGKIMNIWTVAEGDPVGRHVIRIFIDERLFHQFEFDIEQPAAAIPPN